MPEEKSDVQKLCPLIKDTRFGVFTCRHASGLLHGNPLTTQNRSLDEGSPLYFFMARNSEIASQIEQDARINVAHASPGDDRYLSVSGDAAMVEDKPRKEALWSPMAKAWFPEGPGDANLALLEVRIRHAEYWDVTESKMVQLAKMAKAAFTGVRPRDLGEHKELRIS